MSGRKLNRYKVLVWRNLRTNDWQDGYGDFENRQLSWNGFIVEGYSEDEVREHWEDKATFGEEYVLEEFHKTR
jgi:hypothetical protein